MHQRFAAGKRDAATGIRVERLISDDFVHDFLNSKVLTAPIHALVQAGIDTRQTLVASSPIDLSDLGLGNPDRAGRTDIDTRSTSSAPALPDDETGSRLLRFWIGTPRAS